MNKFLSLGILVGTLFIAGCSNSQNASNNTTAVSTPINIFEVKDLSAKNYPLENQQNTILSQDFQMKLNYSKDSIGVDVKNLSKKVIFINWSDATYIGLDGVSQRAFDLQQKDKGFYTKAIDAGLRPGDSASATLVPVKNLKVLFATSSSNQDIFIESNLFSKEIKNKKREYAELIIPVIVDGNKGSMIKVDILFGEGNVPKEFKDKTKKIIVATPKTTELKQIIVENEKLNAEIENKNELLKQLNEKVRLQEELRQKEMEIQLLMKKLK